MNNASSALDDFVRGLEEEIRANKALTNGYAVILMAAAPHIERPERRKLLGWGEMVLRTTAPQGAIVDACADLEACVMVLPVSDERPIARADAYGEQLNKLPVAGVAPGLGWTWDARLFARGEAGAALMDFLQGF